MIPAMLIGGSALLGMAGGALSKRPLAFDAEKYGVGPLWSPDQQKGYATGAMDYLGGVMGGQQKGLSRGEMSRFMDPGKAAINQQVQTGLHRLGEGNLAAGRGARGGALAQNQMDLQRAGLNATRQLGGQVATKALDQRQQEFDRMMRAAGMQLGGVQQERGLQSQLAQLAFQSQNQRHMAGDWLTRTLRGTAGGLGQGLFGAAQMQAGGAPSNPYMYG